MLVLVVSSFGISLGHKSAAVLLNSFGLGLGYISASAARHKYGCGAEFLYARQFLICCCQTRI
jgi:hypothetical protein